MGTTHQGLAAAQSFRAPIARQAVADGVIQVMARIAAAISHELRIRRDMRQLMAMDQHMLSDIASRAPTAGTESGPAVNAWPATPPSSHRTVAGGRPTATSCPRRL